MALNAISLILGLIKRKSLNGTKELKDRLPGKIESLDSMDLADLPRHWQERPSVSIEENEDTVETIILKLQEQAELISKNVKGVRKLKTEIGITSAPGISLPIWVDFSDGSREGVVSIVVRSKENTLKYIWTQIG